MLKKIVKEAIESAIQDVGVDLVSDMVTDNPSWWGEQVAKVLEPSLKKALKEDTHSLLKGILEEVVKEHVDGALIEGLAQTEVKTKLQFLKINVEVKQ